MRHPAKRPRSLLKQEIERVRQVEGAVLQKNRRERTISAVHVRRALLDIHTRREKGEKEDETGDARTGLLLGVVAGFLKSWAGCVAHEAQDSAPQSHDDNHRWFYLYQPD
jgi:hypothetical protein